MAIPSHYAASDTRYDTMHYASAGCSGLQLPRIALGLWHNFGDAADFDTQRATLRAAFDAGIIHFDLANNYGPANGAAEANFGRHLAADLRPYRDELVISTKAGYDMWPGPHGDGGSRKYLIASIDQSLKRMGLDYVDIFYHHRPDPSVPLAETMGALDTIVRSGKALYVGISNYTAEQTREAAAILRDLGTPLTIHQPRYSLLDRWIENGTPSLLDVVAEEGIGTAVFSPLEQGILTDQYLAGIPAGSRASEGRFLKTADVSAARMEAVRALVPIAAGRGQSIAQLALSWVLREGRVTTAIVGASSPKQLLDSAAAASAPDLTADECAAIEVALGDLPRVR